MKGVYRLWYNSWIVEMVDFSQDFPIIHKNGRKVLSKDEAVTPSQAFDQQAFKLYCKTWHLFVFEVSSGPTLEVKDGKARSRSMYKVKVMLSTIQVTNRKAWRE